jgi:hypothetical protein
MPINRRMSTRRAVRNPPSTPRPVDSYVTFLSPRFWFRADNTSMLTGSVTYLQNKVGSDKMWVTGTLPVSGSNSLFNGQPTLSFEATQWANSSLPASSHTFEHDGTGVTIVSVHRVRNTNGAIIAQTNNAGSTSGFQMAGQNFAVQSGSSSVISLSVVTTLNVPAWKVCTHGTSASPNASMTFNNAVQGTTNNATTPATAAPAIPLRIGAYGNGTGAFAGDLADLIVLPYVATPNQFNAIRLYVLGRYRL